MVYNWLFSALDGLLPRRCVLCDRPDAAMLCPGCRGDLPWLGPACRRCGEPLPRAGGAVCGRCLSDPPPFERVLVPLAWRPPADRLIHDLKFHGRTELARALAGLWEPGESDPLPEALVPVPLHPQRLRERGYDQALLLARAAGRRLGLPVLAPCRRLRPTPPQRRLDAATRRRNLQGAFSCTEPLRGLRHLALVDDVMTTGSTLRALALALRARGAQRIDAWVVARA